MTTQNTQSEKKAPKKANLNLVDLDTKKALKSLETSFNKVKHTNEAFYRSAKNKVQSLEALFYFMASPSDLEKQNKAAFKLATLLHKIAALRDVKEASEENIKLATLNALKASNKSKKVDASLTSFKELTAQERDAIFSAIVEKTTIKKALYSLPSIFGQLASEYHPKQVDGWYRLTDDQTQSARLIYIETSDDDLICNATLKIVNDGDELKPDPSELVSVGISKLFKLEKLESPSDF